MSQKKVKVFLLIWDQNCKEIFQYSHTLLSPSFNYFNHSLPTHSKVFPAICIKTT